MTTVFRESCDPVWKRYFNRNRLPKPFFSEWTIHLQFTLVLGRIPAGYFFPHFVDWIPRWNPVWRMRKAIWRILKVRNSLEILLFGQWSNLPKPHSFIFAIVRESSMSKLRVGLPGLFRFLVVIFLASHLFQTNSHHKLYSKTTSRTEINHQNQIGEAPGHKTQFKNQIVRHEPAPYRLTGFCMRLKSLKTLFISNYERNVFYVLTTINAP